MWSILILYANYTANDPVIFLIIISSKFSWIKCVNVCENYDEKFKESYHGYNDTELICNSLWADSFNYSDYCIYYW